MNVQWEGGEEKQTCRQMENHPSLPLSVPSPLSARKKHKELKKDIGSVCFIHTASFQNETKESDKMANAQMMKIKPNSDQIRLK